MSDENAQYAAVVALLASLNARPYDSGGDDGPPNDLSGYTEVHVSRRFADLNDRMTGETTRDAWRITLYSVGDRPSNARAMRARASGIENRTVTVGGVESSPIKFETSDDIAPEDNGRSFVGQTTFTYAF